MQEVLGIAHCLACKFRKFSNNERVALPRGKHFGALPSRLLAALAKQNKRFVSSRKHVERTTTWRKKSAIPFTIVSKKNYEIFHERAKQEEYFSKKRCMTKISIKKKDLLQIGTDDCINFDKLILRKT